MPRPDRLTEEAFRARVVADESVPDTIRGFLQAGARLEAIRLDERGVWWHQGAPFENTRLSQLFHRSLRRTDGGTWLLEIGRYSYPVIVDRHGAFVVALEPSGTPTTAVLADGARVPFAASSLRTDGGSVVTMPLPDGREARLVDRAWRALEAGLDTATASDEGGAAFVYVDESGVRHPIRPGAA